MRYDLKKPGDRQIDAPYYAYQVRQSLEDTLSLKMEQKIFELCEQDNVLTHKQIKRLDGSTCVEKKQGFQTGP